jgi:hypothetical protein
VEDLLARVTTHTFTRDHFGQRMEEASASQFCFDNIATAAKLEGELFSPPARKAAIAAQDILTVN